MSRLEIGFVIKVFLVGLLTGAKIVCFMLLEHRVSIVFENMIQLSSGFRVFNANLAFRNEESVSHQKILWMLQGG